MCADTSRGEGRGEGRGWGVAGCGYGVEVSFWLFGARDVGIGADVGIGGRGLVRRLGRSWWGGGMGSGRGAQGAGW